MNVCIAQQVVFASISVVMLGAIFWSAYTRDQTRYVVLFLLTLLTLCAFYLLQFGSLYSFSVKGLSTEATFVQQKKREVARDAAEISKIKETLEMHYQGVLEKQVQFQEALLQMRKRFQTSFVPWSTNVHLYADDTGIVTHAWGNTPYVKMHGSATITADLTTWPADGIAYFTLTLDNGTNSVTFDPDSISFIGHHRLKPNTVNSIDFYATEERSKFKALVLP